tara:strand:+ start:446 stop:664 length:219 start_codon:yes stop_codon:yes gene_type:complete
MKGLEKKLETKQGTVAVFKQLRSSIVNLTDSVMNDDMMEYDINGVFGALTDRMKAISIILQKKEDDKLAKRK